MEIIIKKDTGLKEKVTANKIHGKFPYKTYLQLFGNSTYGDYIAVISNRPIQPNLDTVVIQLKDKLSMGTKNSIRMNVQGNRPNSIDGSAERYKVKEVSVLDVGTTPLLVFRPVEKE